MSNEAASQRPPERRYARGQIVKLVGNTLVVELHESTMTFADVWNNVPVTIITEERQRS